jgi:glutathione S-transferase
MRMQFYYSPGACSLASHITLQELGVPYEGVSVNLRDKKTSTGEDYNHINPKGYVPALKLDNGELLTEGAALLAYLGELQPQKQLIPMPGTLENYRVREWLIYISGELHKNCGPLFRPDTPEAARALAADALKRRLAYVNEALAERNYLVGERFTVADAYLFTVLRWAPHLKVDLSPWPNLLAFQERVRTRPAVQAALKAEGLPVT